MASRTCDLVERVHPAHQFDLDALLRYASSRVHTFPRSLSKFSVSQVSHFSLPAYLRVVWLLRKKKKNRVGK
ncbi:hypothetical protein HYC85_015309 [Camellia sinensis]|uniref:Uncharacterized protein n=1 Tax=Camellia sinensis TaxID=4442 RepID=A0A7J7GYL7_CAMSI|nr:hypothetical protein HYC85_015309 [Camellia sinensis]